MYVATSRQMKAYDKALLDAGYTIEELVDKASNAILPHCKNYDNIVIVCGPGNNGADGPNAFDCSGFVKWCYSKVGISLPHSSSAQKSAGTQISVSAAEPGDILWKSGHVGIYIGGGKYIHAPQTGDVVKISSVSGSGFVCAIRVK